MKHAVALLVALSAAAATPALANEALAKKNACLACHAIDRKLVGPAYKDVANKYKGDPKAVDTLVQKVKKGSVGVWGQVPMPPNANVSDADAKALVQWILSLK